ncbi:MAG: putative Ig domain-containing protein, partial [Solirubrobacteraceae bacterium]
RDSTITGSSGVGVLDNSSTPAAIYGSTITGSSGDGVDAGGGAQLTLGADLLASNGSDCATYGGGTIIDAGYNYSDNGACPGTGTSHNGESGLAVGALASNGGGTQTESVTPGSTAYDVIPVGATVGGEPFCSGTDQRGVPRTGPTSGCSVGAFQYAPPVVTGFSPTASVEPGLPVTLHGYGLVDVTSADVGSSAATITSETAGSLTLDVPLSLALGSQPITLRNPDGSTIVAFNTVGPPGVSTPLLPPGQYEVAYSQPLAVTGGGAPYSYALTSGALPVGLSLASSGVVSGTPTRAGGAAFGVTVTDANGVSSSSFTVSLVIATPVISIESARLRLSGSLLPVTLSCAAAPCKGSASLTESVKTRVKGKVKATTVVLASVRYSLTSEQSGSVTLALTPAGVKALKHVKKHSRKETLNVTAAAATTDSSTVLVS